MSYANYNEPSLGSRATFKLDLTKLNQLLVLKPTVGPIDADEMASLLSVAAQVTKIPLEFFETVLKLEASYPARAEYSSRMPRDGDGRKALPDARYPHPSAYSARPPSGKRGPGPYYGLANVNRGTQIYIGVTQMSFDFWTDVKTAYLRAGVKREYLPLAWWQAPLLIQIIAPLVYYTIYGSQYSDDALVTPATVYMLHQQGPGWVKNGLGDLDGHQSVETKRVLGHARRAARGYI